MPSNQNHRLFSSFSLNPCVPCHAVPCRAVVARSLAARASLAHVRLGEDEKEKAKDILGMRTVPFYVVVGEVRRTRGYERGRFRWLTLDSVVGGGGGGSLVLVAITCTRNRPTPARCCVFFRRIHVNQSVGLSSQQNDARGFGRHERKNPHEANISPLYETS